MKRANQCGRLSAFCLTILLGLSGCTGIGGAIDRHDSVRAQIKLGDSQEHVLPILESAQSGLDAEYRKAPERFMKDGKRVLIYYARSRLQDDSLTTDDEFTPYVFVNGRLQAIGWQTLGGPKSQGQARDKIIIRKRVYDLNR